MASATLISPFSTSPSLALSPELLAKILITHSGTTDREVDLQPLVKVIDGILQNAAFKGAYVVSTDMNSSLEKYEGMRAVLDDIRRISCEMSCNQTKVDAPTMAITVLTRLSKYSWNAKMVLAVAAFGVSVGDLLMVVNYRTTDPIAKSLDIIKGQPPNLTLLSDLLKAMQAVVQTNMSFLAPLISTLPKYSASMKAAEEIFPAATFNILRIIIQIASILSKKEDNIELIITRFIIDVQNINLILREKLLFCKKEIEQGMQLQPSPPKPETILYPGPAVTHEGTIIPYPGPGVTHGGTTGSTHGGTIISYPGPGVTQGGTHFSYEAVWELIPTTSYWELIKQIKYSLKIQVPDNLRNKHVLFLVSDLDISIEEIKVLNRLYELKSNEQRYEIVWLPMVEGTSYNSTKLSELQKLMKWSSVDPSKMGTVMIEYIKKEWHFVKNPIAVALNPNGSVASPNALPMLYTWGNAAFPFDGMKENKLWIEKNGWRLDLLIDEHIHRDIPLWIHSSAFVCLLGGENKSWIQDFIEKVKFAGIPLKLVYVGSNKGKGTLGHGFGLDIHVMESESQWHFWTRLESILYAKIQQGKTTKTDLVMKEASRILGYAAKGEAWATFSMGTTTMVTAKWEMATNIVTKFGEWNREIALGTGFLEVIRNYYLSITKAEDAHVGACINFHLPVMLGEVPGKMSCPDCFKEMKVFYTYRCCNE